MPAASRWGAWIAGGVILIGGAAAFWYSRSRAEKTPIQLTSTTETLVPGVHILAGLGPSAAYAVETVDGLILIDSGLEADAGPLKAELAKLGLDWKRIIAIFLTHAHGDHTGGAQTLRSSTGARVYAGQGDAGVLEEGTSQDAFFSTFPMPNHSPHPTEVDVHIRGGEQYSFGNTEVTALAYPGHTPGSVCYLVERAGMRILFTGDVIMQVGGPKAAGTYSAYLAPRYRGDAATYLASMTMLRKIPVPDLVLPGHPFTDIAPQYPKLSQSEWEELVDGAILELTKLIARTQADGPGFLDGSAKPLAPGLTYLGDREGQAVYWIDAASKSLLVNAPGGKGLAAFVERAMRGLKLKPAVPEAILLTSITKSTAEAVAEFPRAWIVAEASKEEAGFSGETLLIRPSEFEKRLWLEGKVVEVRGREAGSVAYALRLASKTALFTPRTPSMFGADSIAAMTRDLGGDRMRIVDTLWSIQALGKVLPNLWLPSHPSEGQNANLYEDQWAEIISNNHRITNALLQATE